jgi:hypothetical protein
MSGNFSYSGSFSCEDASSCMRQVCFGASNHTGPVINNICLQPILMANPQCVGDRSYTFPFILYLFWIFLEFVVVLLWIWEISAFCTVSKKLHIVVLVMITTTGAFMLPVSLIYMVSSQDTMWYILSTLSIRFVSIVILSTLLFVDLLK